MRAASGILCILLSFQGVAAAWGAGACCTPGSCVDAADAGSCSSLGGVFLDGGSCAAGDCGVGACCSEVACLDGLDAFGCISGGREPAGPGTMCADDPCGTGSGACCRPRGCTIESGLDCAQQGGVWRGADTTCTQDACAPGACCDLITGSCADGVAINDCASGVQRFGLGLECAALDPPCAIAVGTCCTAGGCVTTTETVCGDSGGEWLDDVPCDACPPAGACCVNGRDCALLTAVACGDQGFTWLGADTACGDCPLAPACDRGAVFAQDPAVPPSFFGGTSELASDFRRADEFDGVTLPIDRVRWWGIDLEPLPGGGWIDCADDGSFIVSFHADDGGQPAQPAACTYPLVPRRTIHPLLYTGTELNVYEADLPTPCELASGWIAITGAGDPECWFLWMSADEPGKSWCDGCPGGFDIENFSFCLESSTVGECKTTAACSDTDGDGLRDDLCTWWECAGGACVSQDVVYGDVGGPETSCAPDGVVDEHDRENILLCFADTRAGTASAYPCEDNAPFAVSADIAAPYATCVPDGVCDGHDAFAVAEILAGMPGCTCDPEPWPHVDDPVVFEANLAIEVRSDARRDRISADVVLLTPLKGIRGYQLHLTTDRAVRVIRITPADTAPAWSADNRQRQQTIHGWDEPIDLKAGTRLATFELEADGDAARLVRLDLSRDANTFFFSATPGQRIEVGDVRVNRQNFER